MTLDSDFVVMNDECIGRLWMPVMQRIALDLVCRLTGHLLWRIHGAVREVPGHSLSLRASYCRRCFKGGYVTGDYA